MLFFIGVVGNFLPFYLISWAEQYIQSSTAGILMGVGPILTLILSHFFTKDDRFSFTKLISICIGFIGVLFIFEIGSFFNINSSNSFQLLSKFVIILAALGYMISNIVAYNTLKHIDSFSITFYATFFGTFFIGSLGFVTGLWSEKFDHTSAITNFIIQPLAFLSGVFYTIDRLPLFFQKVSAVNPFFHIINIFRYGFLGVSDGHLIFGLIYLPILALLGWFIAFFLYKKGYKIKS